MHFLYHIHSIISPIFHDKYKHLFSMVLKKEKTNINTETIIS